MIRFKYFYLVVASLCLTACLETKLSDRTITTPVYNAAVFNSAVTLKDKKGGWVSSGGEIFQYARNPWFLKNVAQANYCTEIDTATISASRETVKAAITTALSYWKYEMSLSRSARPGEAAIANQTFIEQTKCDENTDVHFKIGYGALTAEEIEYLKDPRIYVGVTVRTEYDLKTLKGKGFVYISSDKGPYAYKNSGELLSEAWRNERLLQYALIHETGHIMGLSHNGTSIMSEIFLNQVIHKRFSAFYLKNPLLSFINEPNVFEVCNTLLGSNGNFNTSFFLIGAETGCMKIQLDPDTNDRTSWDVYASKEKENPQYTQIGKIKIASGTPMIFAEKPSVLIQLPEEQEVFNLQEKMFNTFMIGPIYKNRTVQGHFTSMSSHRPYPLQIQFSPDSVVLTGIVGNRMLPVLTYAPPSLTQMMLPSW